MTEDIKYKQKPSPFIIKINDGFCEWEYGFEGRTDSIEDFVRAIETQMGKKREYEKLVWSRFNRKTKTP